MKMFPELSLTHLYHRSLTKELGINQWVQVNFGMVERFLLFLSENFETSNMMSLIVPLTGVFHQELLMRLVCALSVVNTLNSCLKWVYHESRPYWWLRELYATGKANSSIALSQYRISCDTSAGMPCAHSMSFTVYIFILSSYLFPYVYDILGLRRTSRWRTVVYSFVGACVTWMWISRLYLATEFLHQCIVGTYFAVHLIYIFERNAVFFYTRTSLQAVLAVMAFVLLTVLIYFGKLRMGLDPHWSVRQAFKWCPDPGYLHHETSPMFRLARDFGSLMGIALSSPLSKWNTTSSRFRSRFVTILGVEFVNFGLRHETPKQYGRVFFLAYEFMRNMLHSILLIKYISKLQ